MILKNPLTNDTQYSDIEIDGFVEITYEELLEIYALRAIAPENPDIKRLREIDLEAALTPRAFRELVMLVTEGFKQATNGALDLSVIPGVAFVFAKENEAMALRSKLNSND